jgi:hypothetical protein
MISGDNIVEPFHLHLIRRGHNVHIDHSTGAEEVSVKTAPPAGVQHINHIGDMRSFGKV